MNPKSLRLIALAVLLAIILSGCSPIVVGGEPQAITIYATFYPIYALTGLIVKDVPDLKLNCLVQPQDGCLLAYELSDWDLYLLAYSADGVIAGGCGLESFESRLQSLSNVSLAEVLYGLELYHQGDAENDESNHFDGENPHLYMSVDGAMRIVESITGSMSTLDAKYAELYSENLNDALEQLSALQNEVQEQTKVCANVKTVVMNEALIYCALDYQMEISAVIERESGSNLYDTELEKCLETAHASGAKVVLIERQAPQSLIEALESEGFAIAKLDVLATLGESDGFEGYFDAQRANAASAAKAVMHANGQEGIE